MYLLGLAQFQIVQRKIKVLTGSNPLNFNKANKKKLKGQKQIISADQATKFNGPRPHELLYYFLHNYDTNLRTKRYTISL